MISSSSERGTTLLEALVAASLLVTLVGGLAGLFLHTHQLGIRAEQATTATLLAASLLAELRAIPWDFDLSGSAREAAEWALSPPGTLTENVSGHYRTVDAAGQPDDAPDAGAPMFVLRWAVVPTTGGSPDLLGAEACVLAWPVHDAARPLVCLASVRTRQP